MNRQQLRALLDDVGSGTLTPEAAQDRLLQYLRQKPYEDIGFARVDMHRATRQGFPEVVFGQGKTPDQIAAIAERIVAADHALLVTRTERAAFDAVVRVVPDACFHELARCIARPVLTTPRGRGIVLIAAAGTADVPIAEEAALTAEVMGNDVDRLYDVGVAGLHRLLREHDRISSARVVIVVAGMEGALPSVVAGLVDVPVVAVPTSVGYGASFGGLTALLAMLNSCAIGVSVVNIDNGFGAAAIASSINHLE
ncbi:MAG TPA: nickel pincer cofactor biosynthesis protein LarB [Vicinamibacterales bacterium]|jgi:NCAIR mutase (PurE)-related protein|nr:nickel pincer cofactor biosynthesis protein LarB [Vicinamibacterales bacterium]